MKTSKLLFCSLIAVALTACGGQKKVVATQAAGEVEINVPCSGLEFQGTNEYLRASASAFSQNMQTAKSKALTSARAEMASSLNTLMKRCTENYVNSYEVNQTEEAKGRFNDLSMAVAKEQLAGTRVICEKYTKTADGMFRCYVAMELGGKDIVKAMEKRIKSDDKLRIDFEYENFSKVADKAFSDYAEGK